MLQVILETTVLLARQMDRHCRAYRAMDCVTYERENVSAAASVVTTSPPPAISLASGKMIRYIMLTLCYQKHCMIIRLPNCVLVYLQGEGLTVAGNMLASDLAVCSHNFSNVLLNASVTSPATHQTLNLRVSNNGLHFSNELKLTIYDSLCMECSAEHICHQVVSLNHVFQSLFLIFDKLFFYYIGKNCTSKTVHRQVPAASTGGV